MKSQPPYSHMFLSLGGERGVAPVPGGPSDGSGGGQRHQGGGSAGAAHTQEAAAGGAGSQRKTFHRPWSPAGSQVPTPPCSYCLVVVVFPLPLTPQPPPPSSLLFGCSSFVFEHNVDIRYLPEYCHIPTQGFLHVMETVVSYLWNCTTASKEADQDV